MKRPTNHHRKIPVFALASIAMLTAILPAGATTHVVKFGGSAGLKYVPAAFAATAGDTVTWEGDFSVHPLSSTTLPAGAATWHVATGTRFTYVIKEQV